MTTTYAEDLGHELSELEAVELLEDFCDFCDFCNLSGLHCRSDIRIMRVRLNEATAEFPPITCGMPLNTGGQCARPSLHAGEEHASASPWLDFFRHLFRIS